MSIVYVINLQPGFHWDLSMSMAVYSGGAKLLLVPGRRWEPVFQVHPSCYHLKKNE